MKPQSNSFVAVDLSFIRTTRSHHKNPPVEHPDALHNCNYCYAGRDNLEPAPHSLSFLYSTPDDHCHLRLLCGPMAAAHSHEDVDTRNHLFWQPVTVVSYN